MTATKSLRKSLLLFLSFALIASWASVWGSTPAQAAGAKFDPLNQPVEQVLTDITDGVQVVDFGNCTDDCASGLIPIGFDFKFNSTGNSFNQLYVSTNGHITFTSASTAYNPISTRPTEYIAPFYNDLTLSQYSKVLYVTIGTGSEQKFIIQYTNMLSIDDNSENDLFGTFQVILSKEGNNIQFQYPTLVGSEYGNWAFGSKALIGIKNDSGEVEYSDLIKSLKEKQAILFTPDNSMEYSVEANADYVPVLLSLASLPDTPTPTSPADGSYGTSSLTFQWENIEDADSYRLLIAEDAEFLTVVKDLSGIEQSYFEVSGLEEGTSYYWKVISKNDSGYTFSNTHRFLLPMSSGATPKPLNQPVEIQETGLEVVFDDDDNAVLDIFPFEVNGKLFNQLFVNLYGNMRFVDQIDSDNNVYIYPFSDDDGLEPSIYTKAIYKTYGTEANHDRKFVIQYTNMGLCCNDDYDPLNPFGTFQVIFYESSNEIQFQYPNLLGFEYDERSFGRYAYIGIELSSGEFYYSENGDDKRVAEKQAIRFIPDGSGNYTISENARYEPRLLNLDALPTVPAAISPADGSISPPQFQWSEVSGTGISYRLLIATDAKFKSIVKDEKGITQNSMNVSQLEEGKRYYWKIASVNNEGYTFSNTYVFRTLTSQQAVHVETVSPSAITTMTATIGGNVTANAGSVIAERGVAYSLNTDPTINDNKSAADTTGTGVYSVKLSGLHTGTNYYARAYAISGASIFYGPEITFKTFSSNASLNTLNLSGITLDPSVSESVYAYTASVPYSMSSTTVMATVSDAVYGNIALSLYDGIDSLVLGPMNLASGTTSEQLPLKVGRNLIELVLTAADGSNKLYSVTITRAAAPAPSSGGGGGGVSPITSKNGKITIPVGRAGEVSLDGDIEITIPANASSKQLEITIEKLLNTQGLLGNKEILASAVYEALKNFPENFGKSVTLTLKFDASKLKSGQTVAIFYYDESKKTWVKVEGGKIKGDRISADVDHFTKFAVLVVDEKTGKPVGEAATTEPTEPNPEVKISDISGHWAEANIKDAVKQGIVKGYTDGTFKPNATVTRAEFAVMLNNALKPAGKAAGLSFADNAKIGAWAREAIAQAVQANVIKGFTDGTFRPNSELSRAEMAAIVANALKLTAEANKATGFADDKLIPNWAKGAIGALTKLEVMQGKSGNKFDANATTTRAEAVTVLLKMLAHSSK